MHSQCYVEYQFTFSILIEFWLLSYCLFGLTICAAHSFAKGPPYVPLFGNFET